MQHDPYGLDGPDFRENPFPAYAQLRARAPVYFHASWNAWLLTRYQDVLAGFRDPRLSCKRAERVTPHAMPETMRRMQALMGPMIRYVSSWMLMNDPPDHTRLRSLVNKAFTSRMVESLRPRIQSLTDQLLDRVEDSGRMDVMRDLANVLPVLVIGEMLGLPPEDGERLKAWSDMLAALASGRVALAQVEQAAADFRELERYLEDVLARRRKDPGNDLISTLLAAEEEGRILNEQEILSTCLLLLFAGHETTTSLIGNGLHALLHQPEQLWLLRDSVELPASAIDELLRYDSPVQRMSRLALEDMEVGGQRIAMGERIFLMMGSANRDPEQFSEPDRLDVRRENNRHLAFGMGIHYCAGAPLARLEGQIVIGTVLRRFPHLRVAPERPMWSDNTTFRGMRSFPVLLRPEA
ncbi:cytochrome P450 [Archangium violaceum]|uniref:cytochrome P450 n=1 Tax=Archangium violaceum TaxID=83451 RepID=UPI00194F43AA|nr:cytochrome P450 [Archangium violaceum]QRN96529.1 cytochrome P450 [Archangium violaceum]